MIGGSADIMVGLYMMGGNIIIRGNASDMFGEMIIGGAIFVAGRVGELGKNALLVEASEEETSWANSILESYGIKPADSFAKIIPKSKRPVYKQVPQAKVKKVRLSFIVEFKREVCVKCGLCARICPMKVIEMTEKGPVAVREADCTGCLACMTFCPRNAIRVIPVQSPPRGHWSGWVGRHIDYLAAYGKSPVRGCGAWDSRLPSLDDFLILPGQTSRPPIDSYREPCDTEVVLGARFAEKPLKLKAPIIIGAMSFGSLSKEAKIAIAKAASRIGIAVNTGEGGMLPEERANAKILIAQYASGRFGVSAAYLRAADAVEIKIGQGAKPGMGGLLLGEKVVGEVAKIRGIPEGTDAISPARHLDIVGPEDLKMKIEQLREITDWKVPIIVKYAAGRVRDDVKIAAKAGADIIVVDCKPAGTGASPHVVTESAGYPLPAAIVEADRALREIGLRDEVSLVVSGGIRTGADVAKALALGADAVVICTGVLVAMGCKQCGLCSTGKCPYGIATQDPALRKRLNVEEAARRIENYLRGVIEELCMFTQLAGKTSPRNLEKEDLRALTLEASAMTGVKLAGIEKPFTF